MSTPTFARANGVGDLIDITFTPVEIGNRLWIDSNRDGRQDADEMGLLGVTVEPASQRLGDV